MGLRAAEPTPEDRIDPFIARWAASSAAERANFQPFATELCDVLGVDRPEPATADPARDRYRFEYPVRFPHPDGSTSIGSIDLYRRHVFVMEAKQGSDQQFEEQLQLFGGTQTQTRKGTAVRGTPNWTVAMQRARGQAERYAKALPIDHGWPPFLIIVDVGHCFELYADFSRTGKSYSQFPDAQTFRIPLDALRDPNIRERLRLIWTDPLSLDPSRRAAEVTRGVSRHLAVVARALESEGHHPELVAGFLMRCLFCMFAEDVASARKMLHEAPGDHAGARAAAVRARAPDALGRDGSGRSVLPVRRRPSAAVQRRPVQGTEGAAARVPTSRAADRSRQGRLARGRARHLRHFPRAGPEPARAAQARRRVHAQALGRAPRHARGHRASARALGQREGHGPRPRHRRKPRRGGQGGQGFSSLSLPPAHPRSGLRLRQFSLRHHGALEAPGRRGPRPFAQRLGRARSDPRARALYRRPAPVSGARDQSARRDHCRSRALDRLPAVALQDPRPGHAGAARAEGVQEHRMPRRDSELRPRGAGARRARPPRHPAGTATA
jgi:hypothetical protein